MTKKFDIQKKAEEALDFAYPMIINFPNAEKFSLAQEIKQAFYGLLRYIMLANNVKNKRREYQEEADAHLKHVIILFNVSKRQKYITTKKNVQLQERLAEIGRMLGGWMKSNN